MKGLKFVLVVSIACFALMACEEEEQHGCCGKKARDGVLIHVSEGADDEHEVLMALNMAVMMADSQDVLMYFDIEGIEVVLKDSPDITLEDHFPSSHTNLDALIAKGVTIMACPGCMKVADVTADDLYPGVQVANKDAFFNFTKGRILTLDY
jgi:predicted peroxiredoxin